MPTTTETPNRADRRLFDDYMTRQELADELRVTPRCLELWAVRREGPPSVKIGRRVFYKIASVRAWLESKQQEQTA